MDVPSVLLNAIDTVKQILGDNKEVLASGDEIIKSILGLTLNTPIDFINLVSYTFLAKQVTEELRKKAPFLHPTWMFWNNIDKFFQGGVLNDKDKQKLIDKLSSSKKPNDTGNELIGIISKIETDSKMTYILNTTKALANAHITLNEYFRICHVVMNTLEEDLQFLKAHIDEKKVKYSIEVGGLMTAGIVYDSGLSESSGVRYSFNELAEMINAYALMGNGENAIREFDIDKPPQTIFLTRDNVATNEEISKMLDNVFGNK